MHRLRPRRYDPRHFYLGVGWEYDTCSARGGGIVRFPRLLLSCAQIAVNNCSPHASVVRYVQIADAMDAQLPEDNEVYTYITSDFQIS